MQVPHYHDQFPFTGATRIWFALNSITNYIVFEQISNTQISNRLSFSLDAAENMIFNKHYFNRKKQLDTSVSNIFFC